MSGFLNLTKEKKLDSYEDLVSDMGRYDNWRGQAFEILCFNNDSISIKVKHIILNIKGDNLLITKLQSKELLIKGNIRHIR